ncbi:MAG: PAS domain S-box protein [Alphaproteobacteria bacterium]|nr:PAS domain S-box protein [Alphaproteobacteria bacterium]
MMERKARERLSAALGVLSDDLLLFDENDRLVYSIDRTVDAPPEGTSFEDYARMAAPLMSEDGPGRDAWIAQRIARHQTGGVCEQPLADGRWLLVKDVRLPDGSSLVTRTDITTIKRSERQSRRNEARFRAVFANAAIGMVVVEPGGLIAEANEAFCRMTGHDDPTGLPFAQLTHPDHRADDADQARRLLAGEVDHYHLEMRYLRKDGGAFWGRQTTSLVRGDDGEKHFAVVMVEDIDDRKRAESELTMLRAVVEASREAVSVMDPDGRPLYANRAHRHLFGTPPSYRGHFAPAARALIDRGIEPAFRRGESWEGVLDGRTADGHVFPVWQRTGVAAGADGRPALRFAFMHDHSGQARVAAELTKAKEAAERADVAKTRFLAAASHDLRQPLQALSLFVAVLGNRPHGPEDATLISRIQDSVQALEGLLNSLLDVSKLEAGLVVPNVETFRVESMLQRLAAEFEPIASAEGLGLRAVPSRALVRSDPALLERILRNLLNNAARYTEEGRILLGCRRRGSTLRIEVWDTGIGIPPDQLQAIFREFHQLGNPSRDRRQGLGLGLAIVERLAALLGHRISVRSTPGRGSVFAIELPLVARDAPARRPTQLSLGIGRRGACIAVIDDEPDVLDSTRLLLESWGHMVIGGPDASTVLDGVALLGRRPDVIIADYRLRNGSTGQTAISQVRTRLHAAIPAVILTGDTAPERMRHAQANGLGLLHKPVPPATLRATIDGILESASSRPPRSLRARS